MIAAWLIALTSAGTAAPPDARVVFHNGAPALSINGKVHSGLSYMTYAPDGGRFKQMGECGITLFSFSATATESTFDLAPLCWTAPDAFDYSNLDERAHMVVDNVPGAYIIPRVYLGMPEWWAEAHREAAVLYDAGGGETAVLEYRGKRVPSFASAPWREDSAKALRNLIRHVEQSDYADRVIGYHVASGDTEEWMQWGSNPDQWADYSEPNVERFRGWLEGKYATVQALRRAWHDETATFAAAAVPPRSLRAGSERGFLRDPVQAQPVIDYVEYTSWLVADTIAYFARVVKDETQGARLAGTFYGYLLELAGEQREQNSGHLAIEQVINCTDIDFIASPTDYAYRQLGTGYPRGMSLTDSVKLHRKLWVNENDVRTWLEPAVPIGYAGKTGTYEESLLMQQRAFGWVLADRLGMWWFDMTGGWYDDPRMLAAIDQMVEIGGAYVDADGRAVAEIAFVCDPKSSGYVQPGNPYTGAALIHQLPMLARAGAPIAFVHLADLDQLPDYKFYIVPNCLAPTRAEREALKKKARQAGVTMLWMGPAGVYRDGALDEQGMADLTGLPLHLSDVPKTGKVVPSQTATRWGWTGATAYGPAATGGAVAVTELSERSDLTVLGRFEESGLPALVAGSCGEGYAVHASVPLLPASFFRALAKRAGVHLYVDTEDVIWASRELLAVSAGEGGPRTLRLPREAVLTDLWTNKRVAPVAGRGSGEAGTAFAIDMPENSTGIYRFE